jgi:hypothetical protein
MRWSRWITILACSVLVLVSVTSAAAQSAPPKAAAKTEAVTKIVLPPVPVALLPDSFAGCF